jgi:hypothetical protein
MTELEVISVHVPKCAGTSLRIFLENSFGADAVHRDYDDRPIDPASPMNLDPDGFFGRFCNGDYEFLVGKKAVHGHFHPLKYRAVRARLRITFLREPVERMISQYFFWKGMPRHGHALHNYFLDSSLTVEQFARLPPIRRLYTSVFFGGVDMSMFDLIGFYEQAEKGFAWLRQTIGSTASVPKQTTNTNAPHEGDRAALLDDTRRLAGLRDILREELSFYERMRGRAPG